MLTKFNIEKYFIAEKQDNFFILMIGIIAIISAIILFVFIKNNFGRGIAIPLIAIGLIQLVVGYNGYKQSDANRIRVVYAYDLNPYELKTKEQPQMQAINKKFVIYKWIEIILFVVSIYLIFKHKNNTNFENSWTGNGFWLGLGMALFIQSILMLGVNYFAKKRAINYTIQLQEKIAKEFGK